MSIFGASQTLGHSSASSGYQWRRLWMAGSGGAGLAVIAVVFDAPRLWVLVTAAALVGAHAVHRLRHPGSSALDSIVLDTVLMLTVLAVVRPPSAALPVVLIYLLAPAGLFLAARSAAWVIGVSVVAVSALRWLAPAAATQGPETAALVLVLAAAVLPAVVWLLAALSEVITGRRAVEMDLERATGRFEILFERSVVPMFRTKFDGVLLDANAALVDLLGFPDRETLEGTSVLTMYVHPVRRIELIDGLRARGAVESLELGIRRFDGSVFTGRLTASLVEHEGETVIEGIIQDVTTEKVARERELVATQVFGQLGSAVVISDDERRISYWNHRAEEMFGFTESDVRGKLAEDVLRSPDLHAAHRVRAQIEAQGFWQGEAEVFAAQNEIIPCAVSVAQVDHPGAGRAGYAMVFTDLSELQAAKRHVHFQALLLEHVQNAVIATDPEGRITYWNAAAERMYGWAAAEVVGRPVAEVTVPITGRVAADEIMETLTRTGMWQGEFEVQRRDGSTFEALVTNALLRDENGDPMGIVGVSADLTQLRRAEARARESGELARSVLEAFTSPVAVIDEHGSIIHVNGAWTRFTILNGGDPLRTGVGVDYLAVCSRAAEVEPEVAAVEAGICDVLQGRLESYAHEYPCHAPGEERWYRMEVAPIPSVGAVISHNDVTADHVARRALEEIVEEKDQFLATVSHELRTPLTAVVGFAEHLRSGDPDPGELPALHGLVADQAREVADLVEDLLMAGRLDTATIAIRPEMLRADEVIAEVVRPWRRSGSIEMEIDGVHTAVEVYADPLRLRQIVRNLVSNAERHGVGPVTISVDHTGDTTRISVSDEGPGIPEEHVDALFRPYALATKVDGQPGSVGLGLYVSRRLAELMGGSLEYGREEHRTVFTLSLPSIP